MVVVIKNTPTSRRILNSDAGFASPRNDRILPSLAVPKINKIKKNPHKAITSTPFFLKKKWSSFRYSIRVSRLVMANKTDKNTLVNVAI